MNEGWTKNFAPFAIQHTVRILKLKVPEIKSGRMIEKIVQKSDDRHSLIGDRDQVLPIAC